MNGRDDFHDIEPYVGEKARCGESARADKHVQARKKMFIEPEMQLPRFNDARAIPIFRVRGFP
jgi:hypothetical protein